MSSKFKIYLKSILIPVIVGALVGFVTSSFIDYNSLIQPPLAPPSILFPIVWSILYVFCRNLIKTIENYIINWYNRATIKLEARKWYLKIIIRF